LRLKVLEPLENLRQKKHEGGEVHKKSTGKGGAKAKKSEFRRRKTALRGERENWGWGGLKREDLGQKTNGKVLNSRRSCRAMRNVYRAEQEKGKGHRDCFQGKENTVGREYNSQRQFKKGVDQDVTQGKMIILQKGKEGRPAGGGDKSSSEKAFMTSVSTRVRQSVWGQKEGGGVTVKKKPATRRKENHGGTWGGKWARKKTRGKTQVSGPKKMNTRGGYVTDGAPEKGVD